MNIRRKLQGFFWDLSPVFLPPLRRLKKKLALWRYRWRSRGESLPTRIVHSRPTPGTPVNSPAVSIYVAAEHREAVQEFLATQTEKSVTDDPNVETTFSLNFHPSLAEMPPTWLESQVLSATAENLLWTVAGWANPAPGLEPAADVHGPADSPQPSLLRLPSSNFHSSSRVQGRTVPQITGNEISGVPLSLGRCERSGSYFLPELPAIPSGQQDRVVNNPLVELRTAFAELPAIEGPPTALFLMPFLAVGGAEKLLFDLLRGLPRERYRCLVVTLEPHRAELGQTVDDCRLLTDHLYTLGDWLPREAHADAVEHLIRRYNVRTLVSWNGTVLFYEASTAWRKRYPELRQVNQLFNHEGGWIAHYGPRFADSVDVHLAVNNRIGDALRNAYGVSEKKTVVIHHGVAIPPDPDPEERAQRRQKARLALNLPENACVVGSFMRMHPQKRPFDILALAKRQPRNVHFLMVGGGPLDDEIDRELAANPLSNLTRFPLRRDTDFLYDAVDVCLLPSDYEGLPVFLLDGLARSIPCVATAVGDVPFLLADGGGIAVEKPGDLDALEKAILTFGDPENRAKEGQRGRRIVAERFGLERYVEAYRRAIFGEDEGQAIFGEGEA